VEENICQTVGWIHLADNIQYKIHNIGCPF